MLVFVLHITIRSFGCIKIARNTFMRKLLKKKIFKTFGMYAYMCLGEFKCLRITNNLMSVFIMRKYIYFIVIILIQNSAGIISIQC